MMKHVFGFSLAAALVFSAMSAPSASAAGAFGHGAQIRDADRAAILDIRHRPGHVPRRAHRRNNKAAVAGALIGAAIVGGAIIANSQPRRRYYDDGYYYGEPAPYYGGNYYRPSQYYHDPYRGQPRREYRRRDYDRRYGYDFPPQPDYRHPARRQGRYMGADGAWRDGPYHPDPRYNPNNPGQPRRSGQGDGPEP
jgi:Ni/Co efflux regulator RcnB